MVSPQQNVDLPNAAEPAACQVRSLKQRIGDRMIRYRLLLLVAGHLVIFSGIYWIAFLMRFTLHVPDTYRQIFWQGLPFVVSTKLAVFYVMGSFHGWWRHVNFSDFISIGRSALAASLLIIAADYFLFQQWLPQIPRTVVVNDFVMTILVLGVLRSTCRVWDERIAPLDRKRITDRALLIGNDVQAAKLAHLINGQHNLGTRVVGLISTKNFKRGQRFSDIRVVGQLKELVDLLKLHRAQIVFVISNSLQGKELRELLDLASGNPFQVKILPPLQEHLRGMDRLPIREVCYDDLLRRAPVELDKSSIAEVIAGKTVLVTGAGGSIGSELCRQIALFKPRHLILLGRGENRIYQIERELKEKFAGMPLTPRIASIVDRERIDNIFDNLKPDIVFHAAAHKHVPLVEQNVGESVINNVLGTKVVADAADRTGVQRFVMVSTDKSVNPTSMMGCTKQMAERYCQALDGESETMFISTRFGNVLGSAGSVVPLFQDQIRRGGPITLTDKRMTRYFMTIPEASQLVLQASSMGRGGEIFVLEMGQPVKIIDLAKDLIRLAGHEQDSIDIVETGIRQGEKLFEELYYDSEQSMPTAHDKILSSYSRMFPLAEVKLQIQCLIDAAYGAPEKLRQVMKEVVPEFICDPPPASTANKNGLTTTSTETE